MIVVGLGGFFHDFNAAALDLSNGRVSAAEEERFSRKKHHPIAGATRTSIDALRFVLSDIGAEFGDVAHVAFADLEAHPLKPFLRSLFPNARFHDVQHHLCHAAAAFFCSGEDVAAILSLDGFGDGESGLLALGEGNRITVLRTIDHLNSIGLEYLRVTFQIGLGGHGSEGKTQGLAPYGVPRFFEDYLKNVEWFDDGGFRLSSKLTNMEGYLAGELYIETKHLFNDFISERIRRRFPDEGLGQDHIDLSASVQKLLETVGIHCARAMKARTNADAIALTGGVALNSSFSSAIRRSGLYRRVYPHPAASDRGIALGAALWFVNHELGTPFRPNGPIVYGGQQFDEAAVIGAIDDAGLTYVTVDDPAQTAAQYLADGLIVGWFQGRSELGARALGNRSILADPRKRENKDILNARVKHREWFRPFAPSVLMERAAEYFEVDGPRPHMTETVVVRPEAQYLIPAVTHVDGTARIQTVTAEDNPLFYRLIQAFERLTGVPAVLNTSFNDAGEPIVESPRDALACLLKTGLDCVVIGRQVAFR